MEGARPEFSPTTWEQIESCLKAAWSQVVKRDLSLLQNEVHEQAVCHRFAVYLESELPGWHIDCEYNRVHHNRIKMLGTKRVRSDIIVHRRGPDGPNRIAIEVKPQHRDCRTDKGKLRGFLSELKYEFAVMTTYAPDGAATFERVL
jgi:hypothetical protein